MEPGACIQGLGCTGRYRSGPGVKVALLFPAVWVHLCAEPFSSENTRSVGRGTWTLWSGSRSGVLSSW